MQDPSVIHNTFVIERNYPKPLEQVFAAFADPAKKRRWYAQGEHYDVEEFEMDFRVGGAERSHSRFKAGFLPVPGRRTTSTERDLSRHCLQPPYCYCLDNGARRSPHFIFADND